MDPKPQPYIPAANWRQVRRKLQGERYAILRETAKRRRKPIDWGEERLPF